MGLDVYNGSSWVDAADVQVSDGTEYVQAKKVKVSDGVAWVLAWVPRVTGMVITFSKTGVQTGEKFDVTVTYAAGYPEGTSVQVTTNTGYNTTFYPVEGATTVKVSQISHGGVGNPVWSAVATNLGGVSPTATATQNVASPPVVITHYHVKVPSGASATTIQTEMNKARDWYVANKTGRTDYSDENSFACVELAASGVYNLGATELHFRRGVRLVGAGSGATRPTLNGQTGTHIFNTDNNGGGGYNAPDYDWLIHNLIIDCNQYTGGISTAHCRRFKISNCLLKDLGGKKHLIEINSSGGAVAAGVYNCIVAACEFTMPNKNTTNGQVRRSEDEPIQLDYSWTGAAPGVANDGTVTNNVLIDACNFHEAPRGFGGHHYEEGSSGEHYPVGVHSNIQIQNCTFKNINADTYGNGANGSGSEGAFRAYFWDNVRVINNTFDACHQPMNLYIHEGSTTRHGDPVYARFAGNIIKNSTSGRPSISCSSAETESGLRWQQVLVENNTWTGTHSGSDYVVAIEDTEGKISGTNYGVIIRNNMFAPTNLSSAEQKAYNKYRAKGADNLTEVLIDGNKVGDGTEDNS